MTGEQVHRPGTPSTTDADWRSGFKTVSSPCVYRKPHLKRFPRPAEEISLVHDDPPALGPTPQEKSAELRHRSRPTAHDGLLHHDSTVTRAVSPRAGKRFVARADLEQQAVTRAQKSGGRKPGKPEVYSSQPAAARQRPTPENTQRFRATPADTEGILHAPPVVQPAAPPAESRLLGRRFTHRPDTGRQTTIPETHPVPPTTPSKVASRRFLARPEDGAARTANNADAEMLRYFLPSSPHRAALRSASAPLGK
eukprot:TRINITY_DN98205_c0_g1_i1.p1 TRINITY_DN98205_c0_g1~~TRINITY_DN98205_c0_g1_i1.p1  ORF type:complete len:253 (+),score=14.52 TRINITY_DN98205_c0_g1_i1:97-855(+)